MARLWLSLMLGLAIAGCSAAGGGGENDPALEQQLQGLRAKNVKLAKQLGALSGKAFDRASKAEKKRNLKGSSRVLRSSAGGLGFNALVLGPLKFKKKAGSFFLNIGAGTSRGGLEDHKSNLSTKRGAAAPAKTSNTKALKKEKKKKKGHKTGTIKSGGKEHKVFIRKKGGN